MTQAATPDNATPTPAERLRASRLARTPAGFQSRRALIARRGLLLALNLGCLAALAWAMASLLSPGGWSAADIGLFIAVMLSAPWTFLGFWTAVIGFTLSRLGDRALPLAAPHWRDLDAEEPLACRIAVVMALRNEDPERALLRLRLMRRELDASPDGARFDFYLLSDTSDAEVARREEALFERHRRELDGAGRATYRRRIDNTGYKAGNIRDFLDRWGDDYALMLPLDADSLMSAETVLRMARVMQRHPEIGILQSVASGLPSASPFSRLFQFGLRPGARALALGAAWWQGDCGPFWGHNALVRIAPFKERCQLPVLPGRPPLGGHVLSHDQVEAVLMRRAGYEVRLAPVENGSWEEYPVTLTDFIGRERRWCNGNMQYIRLLGLPGLGLVSRFQLLQAILMYVAPAAWMAMTALAALKAFEGDATPIDTDLAIGLFAVMVTLSLSPKLIGMADAALRPGVVARFGGPLRFSLGAVAETLFSILMAPVVALDLTIFLIALLAFGRRISWSGQMRDAHELGLGAAAMALWPQAVFGLGVGAVLWLHAPAILPWAAPVLAGLLLAAPFAALTASPALGRTMQRLRFAATPDETAPADILRAPGVLDMPEAAGPAAPEAALGAQQ